MRRSRPLVLPVLASLPGVGQSSYGAVWHIDSGVPADVGPCATLTAPASQQVSKPRRGQ